ncbi:hypothetical protein [Saccharopolyspora hattusasensis]|uniref:hypothetical protein n=1 Tax=Saccharopolyspora hattusasensis TaxID=1128679 RepID=UPI003D978201
MIKMIPNRPVRTLTADVNKRRDAAKPHNAAMPAPVVRGGAGQTKIGFSFVPIVGSWSQWRDIFSCVWQEDPPKLGEIVQRPRTALHDLAGPIEDHRRQNGRT